MIHHLKTLPKYFIATATKHKTFEVRDNDKGFGVGDILCLKEWFPDDQRYSGRELFCYVEYIMQGGQFGIADSHVVMSIELLQSYNPNSTG